MIICDYEQCTGCMACKNICPKNAISVTLDSSYKTVPGVNSDICVGCGKCLKVCPALQKKEYNQSFKCYAAGERPGADTEECSSAGVSAAFCEYVVKNGGTAFGAACENGRVMHIAADSFEAIQKLKGSKYVQSDIDFCYRSAEKELKNGRLVMFTGTPCQIAGLHSYLGKNYENLITVDLICHGVPSANFLDDYLNEVGVSDDWSKITFRQKDEYNLVVYRENEVVFKKNAAFDPYYRAFYNNITLRNNCFNCQYTNVSNRPADITIGDFWGIDKKQLKKPIEGKVSVVLINTQKGEKFWNDVKIPCEERDISEAVSGNAQLKAPSKQNVDTEIFLKNYEKGFMYAVGKTCVKKNINNNKRNYLIERIKYIIKKGLRL